MPDDPIEFAETEVVLLAPDHVQLPELTDALDSEVVVDPPAHHRQHATYYDGPDLPLLRHGTTVRHRVDEVVESRATSARWTVKRPGWVDGDTLSRAEFGVEGGPGAVPAEVRDLVGPDLHGAPLAPVAEIDTERLCTVLRDGFGVPLVEVTDDRVVARPAGAAPVSFREVEVELLTEDDAARTLQRALTDRMRAAGCVSGRVGGRPVPKLARALGARAGH